MNTKLKLLLLMLATVATALAQAPSVNQGGVLNTASYMLDGLPSAGVAQGSMMIIFGERMGPALPGKWIDSTFPLPTELPSPNGTSVKITSGGTTVNALMVYTSAGLIKAILPSNTPVGNATLTVTYNGQTSTPVSIKVVKSGFGIFTLNQAGSGPAVVTIDAAYNANTLSASAAPGQVIVLWGTGLGPGTGDEAKGTVTLDDAVKAQVEVWVGGKKAEIVYAGRGGGYAGLDQINFVVPPGIEGCYVPVYVKIGNSISNYGSISLAPSGKAMCSDGFSYAEADIRKAQASGLKNGSVVLTRTALSMTMPVFGKITVKNDGGTASFGAFDLATLLRSRGAYGISSLGSCVVHSFKGTDSTYMDPFQATPLDAGPSLQITGPKGTKTIDLKSKGLYSSAFATSTGGITIPGLPSAEPFLEKGTYTVKGTGGADIGAFTATLDLPDPLVWANQEAIGDVTRSEGLTITWTGGAANEAVVILGTSVTAPPEVGAAFICAEQASKGTFTVPSAILSSLPASTVSPDGTPTGMLMVGNMPRFDEKKFTATGLDVGYFYYSTLNAKNANFK